MDTRKLTSTQTRFVKDLIRSKKARDAERLFVLEGDKPIRELLTSHPASFYGLIVTEASLRKIDQDFQECIRHSACPVYVCSEQKLAAVSDLTNPTGILAILRRPIWDPETVFRRRCLLGFYGESLQDPTNVGTLIRTAVAFGFDGLWLSPDSVDAFNPKIVRASAGALLSLPIFMIENAGMLTRHDCAILTAEIPGDGSSPLNTIIEIPPRAIVALGNESRGLSQPLLDLASLRFHIPIRPEAESLNVATSAAIAAFHFTSISQR